jgi:hypothetical protein
MNAEVFHGDLERQREWEALQVVRPMIVPIVMQYVSVVLQAAFIYRDNIALRGWIANLAPPAIQILPRDGSV